VEEGVHRCMHRCIGWGAVSPWLECASSLPFCIPAAVLPHSLSVLKRFTHSLTLSDFHRPTPSCVFAYVFAPHSHAGLAEDGMRCVARGWGWLAGFHPHGCCIVCLIDRPHRCATDRQTDKQTDSRDRREEGGEGFGAFPARTCTVQTRRSAPLSVGGRDSLV